MTDQKQVAAELYALLKRFNPGVAGVEINEGIVCVECRTRKAALTDLGLSRGFKNINGIAHGVRRGWFIVHATPLREEVA
jgi:hypothetical protein